MNSLLLTIPEVVRSSLVACMALDAGKIASVPDNLTFSHAAKRARKYTTHTWAIETLDFRVACEAVLDDDLDYAPNRWPKHHIVNRVSFAMFLVRYAQGVPEIAGLVQRVSDKMGDPAMVRRTASNDELADDGLQRNVSAARTLGKLSRPL